MDHGPSITSECQTRTGHGHVMLLQPDAEIGQGRRFFEGVLSKHMHGIVLALKSNYPDTFDWSVYDRIHARFGENQPRGGVVFKTTFKLVNHHSTCAKCHYAFELDSYGRGCLHDCLYCYAKEQLSAYGYWNRPMPFPVDICEIRKVFHTVFETNKPHKWREVMERKVPLRIGSMSDSFLWLDLKYGVTRELLRILNHYEYPYVIFTRSDLVAHRDYLPLVSPKLGSVQFSISGNNEALTKVLEPGAPSVKRRLVALRALSDAGIWTAVRVNPLFPLRPDGFFSDPEATAVRFSKSLDKIPHFPLYDDSFFEEIAASGAKTLIAGFVRLSPQATNAMSKATGVDFHRFFKENIQKGYADRHYSDTEIGYYYRWFAKECEKNRIRFTTCYIGNGEKDYSQYQDLWTNKKDCCDIIGNVKAFNTTSQSVTSSARLKHAPVERRTIIRSRI